MNDETEEHTVDRRRNRYTESEERRTRTYQVREVCDQALPDRSHKTDETLGVDLMQEDRRLKEHWVGNASMGCKGVRGFRSALLRCELAWDGARGFGMGNGCLGMVLMTQE